MDSFGLDVEPNPQGRPSSTGSYNSGIGIDNLDPTSQGTDNDLEYARRLDQFLNDGDHNVEVSKPSSAFGSTSRLANF